MNYGKDYESEEAVREFLDWLSLHGAKFPKIDWPRNDTASGIRGAIALDNIASGEYMVEIPGCLMISPPQIFAIPDLGPIFASNQHLLQGDLLLSLFLMHEISKGKDSFWYPYLKILPFVNCLTEWSDEELRQLQVSSSFEKQNCSYIYSSPVRPYDR